MGRKVNIYGAKVNRYGEQGESLWGGGWKLMGS